MSKKKTIGALLSLILIVSMIGVGVSASDGSTDSYTLIELNSSERSSVTFISGCMEIGSPGTYVLGSDITDPNTDSRGRCINITASNVVFDGNGHTIKTTDGADFSGIHVEHVPSTVTLQNITVKDVVLEGWPGPGVRYTNVKGGGIKNVRSRDANNGIIMSSVENLTVKKNEVTDNKFGGITVELSRNLNITRNDADKNGYGIILFDSFNASITENDAYENGVIGVSMVRTNSSEVKNNTASKNKKFGFDISISKNVLGVNNTANQNKKNGIHIFRTQKSVFRNNTANRNMGNGTLLNRSINNTLRNNTANKNANGLFVFNSKKNKVVNNTFVSNNDSDPKNRKGIFVRSSPNNTIKGNNVSKNKGIGIFISVSKDNSLVNNTVMNNTDGIWVYKSESSLVKNNTVVDKGDFDGIRVEESDDSRVINNTANRNNYGFLIKDSKNISVKNNNASNNWDDDGGRGIIVENVEDSVFANNTVLKNNESGFTIEDSRNNTFKNNTVTQTRITGFTIIKSHNDTFRKNNASNNGMNGFVTMNPEIGEVRKIKMINNTANANDRKGFNLSVNSSTLKNNTAFRNPFIGIELVDSYNNTVVNNTASKNGGAGIALTSSEKNILKKNKVTRNIGSFTVVPNIMAGIDLQCSDHNKIIDNNASNNLAGGIGLKINSSHNTIKGNTVNENNLHGVNIEGGDFLQKIKKARSGCNYNTNKTNRNNRVINNIVNSNGEKVGSVGGVPVFIGSGIRVNASENNTFRNNIVKNNKNWDFDSENGAVDNTVKKLHIGRSTTPTTITFEKFKDISVSSLKRTIPGSPQGKKDIGKYVVAASNSNDSFIYLNVSYSSGDVLGVDERSLRMWQINHTSWKNISSKGINGVNTAQNYVYANLTRVSENNSIVGPFGNPLIRSISSCRDITTSGTYRLKTSVRDTSEKYCINITASNVLLDGEGRVIDSDGTGKAGVYVNSSSQLTNVAVKNLETTNWQSKSGTGIKYSDVDGGKISGVNSSANSNGIVLNASRNITLSNVTTKDNEADYISRNNSQNKAKNLTTEDANLSFESKDIMIKSVESLPEPPKDRRHTGVSANISGTSKNSYISLEMSYSSSVNEQNISIWRYDDGWSEIGGKVKTKENKITANISSFSVFALLVNSSTLSIEEVIANSDSENDIVNFSELQLAISYWVQGKEVPNTGGKKIVFDKLQELISLWVQEKVV